MGEAKRRSKKGLDQFGKNKATKKDTSSRIFDWLPITEQQEKSFIQFTIRASWIGIVLLVLLWIVVRFIGPAIGWWVPADLR
tara:strand:- start:1444 stop:1689 length:246 start_codon:yes stop_codon:yes gene_type:complete